MAREDTRKKWEARVTAFRSSGEKATRWCKAHQVDRRQLYTWMKRIDGTASPKPSTSKWLNVQVAPEPAPETDVSLGVKVGPAVIVVKCGFNPALLRDVVQALKALC
jgi:hypothetical protein